MATERNMYLVPEQYEDGTLGILLEEDHGDYDVGVIKFLGDPNQPPAFPSRDQYEYVDDIRKEDLLSKYRAELKDFLKKEEELANAGKLDNSRVLSHRL